MIPDDVKALFKEWRVIELKAERGDVLLVGVSQDYAEMPDAMEQAAHALRHVTIFGPQAILYVRPDITFERHEGPNRLPVFHGSPIPPGRTTGDCYLCDGEPSACDCALDFSTTPGAVTGFAVEDGRLHATVDDVSVASSPIIPINPEEGTKP